MKITKKVQKKIVAVAIVIAVVAVVAMVETGSHNRIASTGATVVAIDPPEN